MDNIIKKSQKDCETQELFSLLTTCCRGDKKSIRRSTLSWGETSFEDCFMGKDLVQSIMEHTGMTREAAIATGQMCENRDLIASLVPDEDIFQDSSMFFHFTNQSEEGKQSKILQRSSSLSSLDELVVEIQQEKEKFELLAPMPKGSFLQISPRPKRARSKSVIGSQSDVKEKISENKEKILDNKEKIPENKEKNSDKFVVFRSVLNQKLRTSTLSLKTSYTERIEDPKLLRVLFPNGRMSSITKSKIVNEELSTILQQLCTTQFLCMDTVVPHTLQGEVVNLHNLQNDIHNDVHKTHFIVLVYKKNGQKGGEKIISTLSSSSKPLSSCKTEACGREIVDWIMREGMVKSNDRGDAILIGQKLVESRLLRPVKGTVFKDGSNMYKWKAFLRMSSMREGKKEETADRPTKKKAKKTKFDSENKHQIEVPSNSNSEMKHTASRMKQDKSSSPDKQLQSPDCSPISRRNDPRSRPVSLIFTTQPSGSASGSGSPLTSPSSTTGRGSTVSSASMVVLPDSSRSAVVSKHHAMRSRSYSATGLVRGRPPGGGGPVKTIPPLDRTSSVRTNKRGSSEVPNKKETSLRTNKRGSSEVPNKKETSLRTNKRGSSEIPNKKEASLSPILTRVKVGHDSPTRDTKSSSKGGKDSATAEITKVSLLTGTKGKKRTSLEMLETSLNVNEGSKASLTMKNTTIHALPDKNWKEEGGSHVSPRKDEVTRQRRRNVNFKAARSKSTGNIDIKVEHGLKTYNSDTTISEKVKKTKPVKKDIIPFMKNKVAPQTTSTPQKSLQWDTSSTDYKIAPKRTETRRRSSRDASPISNPSVEETRKYNMAVSLDQFVVFLPDDQKQQFFYNPNEKLFTIIDKVATTKSIDKDTYVVTGYNGKKFSLDITVGELGTHYCSYLPQSAILSPKVVQQPECDFGILRARSEQQISEIALSIEKGVNTTRTSSKRTSPKRSKLPKSPAKSEPNFNQSYLATIPSTEIQYEVQDNKCSITAATLGTLITLLMNPSSVCLPDKEFMMVFIMTFDFIIKPQELFKEITGRAKESNYNPEVISAIIEFISKWIQNRSEIIINHQNLKTDVIEWLKNLDLSCLENMQAKQQFSIHLLQKEPPPLKSVVEEIKQLALSEDTEPLADHWVYLTPTLKDLGKGEAYDLFDFHPTALARQMTLHDSFLVKRIPPHEWHGQGWMKERAPNIMAVINRFNEISNWASTLVVLGTVKEVRAMVIVHLVLVALECYQLNNFHAVLALVSGLSATPISRLLQTWKDIDSNTIRTFARLKRLVSMNAKFKGLREAQESVEGPCVPYLGVYLNDLTFIEEANPTKINEILINFEKLKMIANVILKIKHMTSASYSLRAVESLQEYLNHPLVLGEDDIFEESLKREGKEENSELQTKYKKRKSVFGYRSFDF